MKATTGVLLVAGGGVAALVALRLLAEKRAAEQGTNVCAELGKLLPGAVAAAAPESAAVVGNHHDEVSAVGGVLCKITSGWVKQAAGAAGAILGGIVDPRGCMDWHAALVAAHGDPIEFVHPTLAAYLEHHDHIGGKPVICTRPGVLRYADGYVPYYQPSDIGPDGRVRHRSGGSGGWVLSKTNVNWQAHNLLSGVLWNPITKTGDPLTRKHTTAIGNFPLPVSAQESAWWVRGQPMVCSKGAIPGRDQRDGATGFACVTPHGGNDHVESRDGGHWWDGFGHLFGGGGSTNPGVVSTGPDGTTIVDHRTK